jgi:adenine-specific DNA-methyltransferase
MSTYSSQIQAPTSVALAGEQKLLQRIDSFRREANARLDAQRKRELGQFMTPTPVARLMASMFVCDCEEVSVLDAGAGVGSLFASVVADLAARPHAPKRISITAFEIDPMFLPYLTMTVEGCKSFCMERGIDFSAELILADFVGYHDGALFSASANRHYHCIILNPPYRKIRSNSELRRTLRKVGIETSNLYAGFLAVAVQQLRPYGELVAITPRSFCNGPYFKPFRLMFLRELALKHIHVYESRNAAFKEDEVLQENIIVHGVRSAAGQQSVVITTSHSPDDPPSQSTLVPFERVIHPGDVDFFIHLPNLAGDIFELVRQLPCSLQELHLCVSTGRVVDFRARDILRDQIEESCVPLIYPHHFGRFGISWPREGRKPNAIVMSDRAPELLVPNDTYVLVKRFSAKEERRRVVARLYDPGEFPYPLVGFENHLNYFHRDGRGLDMEMAQGLTAFLNSSAVDSYFRTFSGHTQVNATDLRKLRYPTQHQLEEMGRKVGRTDIQDVLDRAVENVLGPGTLDRVLSDRKGLVL